MFLYKPTKIARCTVDQNLREILPAEVGAPPHSIRRVQLIVPASPKVYADIDQDPKKIGLNRTYKAPQMASGAMIRFDLLPDQNMIAAAHEGYAVLSLIIEYVQDP